MLFTSPIIADRYFLVYVSFDTVPAPKGAAIHIVAFVRDLAATFGNIQLVTVSPTSEVINTQELFPNVTQTQLPAIGDTLINRVLHFRTILGSWWHNRYFEAVHIRSIYEGYPIAARKHKLCKYLIFEVNGLPSIELKYRYPAVAEDSELLHKLVSQEQICLEAADLILTPSGVTRDYLISRSVNPSKIRVIPNGVDIETFSYLPPAKREPNNCFKMLYFGTLSAWQGVNLAVEAMALANNEFPTELTVIGQLKDYQIQALNKLAGKLDVTDKLKLLEPMSQAELVAHIHTADAIVAPLTLNDRNLIQGCCPLKVLEGMATGTPVIASDLPVVREFGIDGEHFLLVKPGSAKGILDAIIRLKNAPELGTKLAAAAREKIENNYTWQQAGLALVKAYQELGIKRSITD